MISRIALILWGFFSLFSLIQLFLSQTLRIELWNLSTKTKAECCVPQNLQQNASQKVNLFLCFVILFFSFITRIAGLVIFSPKL